MGINEFFNSIAGNFINRYREMARQSNYLPQIATPIETPPTKSTPPADSVEISPEAQKAADNNSTTQSKTNSPVANDENSAISDPDDNKNAPAGSGATENPTDDDLTDYTKKLKQLSRLDYKMDLAFNLSSLTSVIESISEGDTAAVEEFAAANFGLSADLSFRGFQQINARGEFEADKQVANSRSGVSSRQAAQYSAASKNFKVNSFFNEAMNLRRGMHQSVQNNHYLSVNKFALRYQYDAGMDFSFMNRFNVQTKVVSEMAPESLNNYLTSAGNVAESGTTEMMSAFFDAVDSYLAQAESDLTAKANQFFDLAAEELGFSGDLIGMAKDHLAGSIDSFFDRVNSAVDMLQKQYAPAISQPPVAEPTVDPARVIDPTVVDNEIDSPVMA